MISRIHKPAPPLSEFVDCLWYMEGQAGLHKRERALPTGTVELVFSLSNSPFRIFENDADRLGQRFHGSVICGVQPGYFVLDTSEPVSVVGVHFRPGGAAPFLGMSVSETAGRHLELEDVWGSGARALREQLIVAVKRPGQRMFELIERALLARMDIRRLPHPAAIYTILQLSAPPALTRIEHVRSGTGYSSKRFIELFRESVGITPKMYSRIRRFQSVIERLSRGLDVEWAHVAADSGYYDQSHLNRDFRCFAGVTPGDYRPLPNRPNHTAIS